MSLLCCRRHRARTDMGAALSLHPQEGEGCDGAGAPAAPPTMADVIRERKKKAGGAGLGTLRRRIAAAARRPRDRPDRGCEHARFIRGVVSSWRLAEVFLLCEELEAGAALRDLVTQAELAREPAPALHAQLHALQQDRRWCDVELVGSGWVLPAHRALLAARCSYFRELLLHYPSGPCRVPLEGAMAELPRGDVEALVAALYAGPHAQHYSGTRHDTRNGPCRVPLEGAMAELPRGDVEALVAALYAGPHAQHYSGTSGPCRVPLEGAMAELPRGDVEALVAALYAGPHAQHYSGTRHDTHCERGFSSDGNLDIINVESGGSCSCSLGSAGSVRRLAERLGARLGDLHRDMRYLLDSGEYADARLVFAAEGGAAFGFRCALELPCHRVILAARSRFFRSVLSRRTAGGAVCVDERVLPRRFARALLHAAYTDQVDLTLIGRASNSPTNTISSAAAWAGVGRGAGRAGAPSTAMLDDAAQLYEIARFLEMPIVAQGCEDAIVSALCPESLPHVLRWTATPVASQWVHRQAMRYLRDEFPTIMSHAAAAKLPRAALAAALASPFTQCSEAQALRALLRLAERAKQAGESRVPTAMPHSGRRTSIALYPVQRGAGRCCGLPSEPNKPVSLEFPPPCRTLAAALASPFTQCSEAQALRALLRLAERAKQAGRCCGLPSEPNKSVSLEFPPPCRTLAAALPSPFTQCSEAQALRALLRLAERAKQAGRYCGLPSEPNKPVSLEFPPPCRTLAAALASPFTQCSEAQALRALLRLAERAKQAGRCCGLPSEPNKPVSLEFPPPCRTLAAALASPFTQCSEAQALRALLRLAERAKQAGRYCGLPSEPNKPVSLEFPPPCRTLAAALASPFTHCSEAQALRALLRLAERAKQAEPALVWSGGGSRRRRSLPDAALCGALGSLAAHVRTEHLGAAPLAPQLHQAIRRGIVPAPAPAAAEGARAADAWLGRGAARPPRYFLPYLDELKALLEDQAVPEAEVARIRRSRYLHRIPDTLYMVAAERGGVPPAPSPSSCAAESACVSPRVLAALRARVRELRASPPAARALALQASDRKACSLQIALRAVREVSLPDSCAELLLAEPDGEPDAGDRQGGWESPEAEREAWPDPDCCRATGSLRCASAGSLRGPGAHAPHGTQVFISGQRMVKIYEMIIKSNICMIFTERAGTCRREPSRLDAQHRRWEGADGLSAAVPDVAMAPNGNTHLLTARDLARLPHKEYGVLQLDLGDGATHTPRPGSRAARAGRPPPRDASQSSSRRSDEEELRAAIELSVMRGEYTHTHTHSRAPAGATRRSSAPPSSSPS
ncbi:uncharacterized protein LOC134677249 [Cydia fagiglandana]|uniref:uncharacterized protein LOC134677249 n=1 Tax=Cydia fagiglandana TaxID=1458189 RepID=UPI002FEE3993